ncbi:Gfo/Idh/MocA family oxidoreductase [Cohnella sp. LGH]|uniref:Gfo/Idh/MocA family protein n=1 Tax=Cohnella sp. LGH TaxID=1619153 RepID=UPI001ADA8AE1|nr:Gfo/Idh/MocA family oxidoreductase [Cohnella sp. LGH]QTH46309.1 Gfo/Idh/MocA family oxidoreductase [Cohnella sp. LGH]
MIRFGLIGCGSIATKHAESIIACRDAELVALADPVPERMAALARKYAQARSVSESSVAVYTDPSRLVQDSRIDAVVIAAPSFMHVRWAKESLQAGKHVLLEKPLALSLKDADAIAELASACGRRVQVCHQLRYRPLLRLAKSWIGQGALGKLRMGSVSILLNRSRDYYASSEWRGTWKMDGGMLLNQGVHLIDLLLWLMDERPDSVYGLIGRGASAKETEETAAATIRFTSGAVGSIEATTLCKPNNLEQSLTLVGDRGTIRIGGVNLTEVQRWHSDEFPVPSFPLTAVNEHAEMYGQFIAALQGAAEDMQSSVSAAEARRSLDVAFAVYESSRLGVPVQVPLSSFDTESMSADSR